MKSISIVTYLLFRAVHDNRIGPEDTLQSSENEECVDWKIEPQPENSCSVARSFPTLCDPMDLQHSRFPCPSPSSGACPDSWPLVMPSNHHILCHPLLLLRSIFPSIRVFCNESALHIKWPKYRVILFRWKCLGFWTTETASQKLRENCSKEAGGEVRLYKSLQQREKTVWKSQIRYSVKEFSILWMGRCKPLGSLNSFLSCAAQLLLLSRLGRVRLCATP